MVSLPSRLLKHLARANKLTGMGNRFKELTGYKSIIIGHGVVAAITFLGIIPAAIFMARFYHRSPRLALRMHIWLQILTVLLTTVVFTLGWFAVGPERSLTNPHHGIGLAIFVMVLVQAIGGGLIHHREKGRERFKIPLKLMVSYSKACFRCRADLNDIDAPMAWTRSRHSWFCPNTIGPHSVGVSQSSLHHLRRLGLRPAPALLHSLVQEPSGRCF